MEALIFFLALIFIIVIININKSSNNKYLTNKIRNDFKLKYNIDNKQIYVSTFTYNLVAIDDANSQIIIWENNSEDMEDNQEFLIKFSDLYGVETYVDGTTESRVVRTNQILSAAVGGLLFGGVGAVVGALTANRTQGKVKNLTLRIIKNDLNHPIHEIVFFSQTTGFDRNGIIVKPQEELMESWVYKFNIIIKEAEKLELKTMNNNSDYMTNLRKLHDLKVEGIITEQEYLIEKAKILNQA